MVMTTSKMLHLGANAAYDTLGRPTRLGAIQREDDVLNVEDRLVRIGSENQGCAITAIYKLHQVQFQELSHLTILRPYNDSELISFQQRR